MIFYEAPHKLKKTLADLVTAFGEDRRVTLCRELTKLNEETIRTTLGGAVSYYETNDPRGEYVLVIEGYSSKNDDKEDELLPVAEQVEAYINAGMDRMEAVKTVAKERGIPKNAVYKEVVDRKGKNGC